MLAYIPYIFPIIVNVVIGLVVFLFYQESRRSGLELLSIAFFLNSIPGMIRLGLGGPYFTMILMEQGFTAAEVGLFSTYLFVVSSVINIVFTVLVIVGVFKLARRE